MRINLGDINTVAQQIQKVEGYYPGTLAYINNNPGNLRFANQPGATQGQGGFAAFSSYDAGYQALLNQITLDANNGLTIQQFMNKYAPASDGNDPNSYAQTIASATGLSVNDSLSSALGDGSGSTGVDTTSLASLLTGGLDTSNVDWTTIGLVAAGILVAAWIVNR